MTQNQLNPEVRTRSVPTAAALICMGHEPLGVHYREHGPLIVFAPEARADYDRFTAAKQRADIMLEEAENPR